MSGETPSFHVGFTYGAQNAQPVDGKPAWTARYKLDGSDQWWTVTNKSGAHIKYSSRVAAETQARETLSHARVFQSGLHAA